MWSENHSLLAVLIAGCAVGHILLFLSYLCCCAFASSQGRQLIPQAQAVFVNMCSRMPRQVMHQKGRGCGKTATGCSGCPKALQDLMRGLAETLAEHELQHLLLSQAQRHNRCPGTLHRPPCAPLASDPVDMLGVAGAAVKGEQGARSDAQEAAARFSQVTRELQLLLAVACLEGLPGACLESCGIPPECMTAAVVFPCMRAIDAHLCMHTGQAFMARKVAFPDVHVGQQWAPD